VAKTDPRVRAFRHETNLGKGAALRRAIAELQFPFALVQDADLEYDPRDIRPSWNRCGRVARTRFTGVRGLPDRLPSASGS